jgi:hypothetical protein
MLIFILRFVLARDFVFEFRRVFRSLLRILNPNQHFVVSRTNF